ncbi:MULTISPECIES: sulfite exporter TauE/SafE family protein [Providencia]|uniref:Probable membrane transporter protein n=1 Tax=Providencia stuartii TaxID=588 RepID=A0AAI9HXY0_PROST|nr:MULTISPECIES: sulfite exporter TauE/SafE family protein [Providencia]ELR5043419.1 sulfite exporter TauE/SafE family protein [Providencia rettgeri]ELR5035012.1 sulfite exporter TauE/SafE family protein [Providencia stuartii]ELR5122855.1 sulfite exporter TauE/SafE family protein [Providencia stuartii]ELR5293161.1 sulfite exporter TauE/SafE family protein [Providencia stuartii]ELZ5941211.1 sulfite exporter TauE/SafE family protein [Providencia stuartii]
MPFDILSPEMAICFFTLLCAYLVFGMAGFGSALVATPVLAMYLPLNMIVPTLALIDLTAALINLVKDGKNADYHEIKWIIPLMIVGSLIGAAILLKTRPDILILLLGIFVIFYVLNTFFSKKAQPHLSKAFVVPFSLIGGVFSALFGSGGFIYAMYLSSRIADKQRFRITQMTLIGFSTLTRVIIFLVMGVYVNMDIILMALAFSPAMLIGIWVGRHITLKISRDTFLKIINIIILISGVALLYRYFFIL